MPGYTYLNDEEKLESLVYMSEHTMTSKEELRGKEIEIMGVFLDNFMKESDYDKLTAFYVKVDQGVCYIEWVPDHPWLEYYGNGIKSFIDHMEKYKALSKVIKEKVSSLRHPTPFQINFQVNFPKYVDHWWMMDKELILIEFKCKSWESERESWRCEYSTGENQCEELWKITKEDLMTGKGDLYWDGFHDFTLIRLKLQKLINKHEWLMKHTCDTKSDHNAYESWLRKIESMKIDEKILEDGISEMTYRMKGRDPSFLLKDWRKRTTQNPFKGMTKDFAQNIPQQLYEYFDTAKVDIRRWIDDIINV